MKTWKIKDENGNIIMTVEARTAASAKHAARQNGFKGFCTAEEAEPTQAATIPGKTEYEKILSWKTVCDNIAADENANDRAAARDILGAISGNHARPESIYPGFPCTGEEVERAKKYARFLGEVCYHEFMNIIPD